MKSVYSKWWMYDPERDILYINSVAITPNTRGMAWKDHRKACNEAYSLSYEERVERYATDEQKESIRKALADHPNCKISEYSNVYL